MKNTMLLFAGTSEGRCLAEFCSKNNIEAHVCVATEYGEELIEDAKGITVHTGRMVTEEMEALMKELSPSCVIDATHPYADIVTKNIKEACENTGFPYVRLLREGADLESMTGIVLVNDAKEAAEYLENTEGIVFLTTGLKELPNFAETLSDKSRMFARVLFQEGLFEEMENMGLARNQMICMQGPFSKDLNKAMMSQVKANFLVTKESGAAGGFMEKIDAARELGMTSVVIRRPNKETGMSLEQVKAYICPSYEGTDSPCVCTKHADAARKVTLLGIGMGNLNTMTEAGLTACKEADLFIGANRMLESLTSFGKPTFSAYKADVITDYICEHKEYNNIVIALSGDVGFYSGSKKLIGCLKEADENLEINQICGISSVVYLAAKLMMPWEDMTLVSAHGRAQNVVAAVRNSAKTFCLVSDAKSVRALAELLKEYQLGHVTMHVGVDLSYESERLFTGSAEEMASFEEPGICAVVIENDQAAKRVITHGMSDEEFLRDKVPMTKEEVRTVAISKLQLTKDAIMYDIGSGTGSISIECARMATEGMVYAIERKEEAVALTKANQKKFGCSNLEVVAGLAPEALVDLPAPTHAFIGGSGGNLREIVALLREKNPHVRIVITCIALDTVAEAMELVKKLDPPNFDICCINVSKSKTLGQYHMLMGQNPVFIYTMEF